MKLQVKVKTFYSKLQSFTGSLGYALIYQKNQFLYVDGRYHQQAKIQSKKFIIKDIFELKKDLSKFSKNKKKLLIDPRTFSYNFFKTHKLINLFFFTPLKNKKRNETISNLSKIFAEKKYKKKLKKLI